MAPETAFPSRGNAQPPLAQLQAVLRKRAESFVADVVVLQGTAEIHDPITGRARPVEGGVRLARGMRLTVKSGRALVRFNDGSDLWLAAGASIDLSPWSETARSLRLLAGRALALVARDPARPFRALVPLGEVLVTGTAFEAIATVDRLDVAVLHGSVQVKTDRGTVRAQRGNAVTADSRQAPRLSPASPLLDWVAEQLSFSSSNGKIRPAFQAVAQTAGVPTGNTTRMEKHLMPKVLVAVVAAALISGAVYYLASSGSSPNSTTSLAAQPGANQAASHAQTAGPGGKGRVIEDRKAMIVLRGQDGKDIQIDASDPAATEKALASLPPEKAAKLREALKNMKPGGGNWTGSGPGALPAGHERVASQAESAVKTMNDLIKGGMSPEDAKKAVEAGLADSLKKQLESTNNFGKNDKIQVSVDPAANGGDGGRIMIMHTNDTDDGDGTGGKNVDLTVHEDGGTGSEGGK